MHLHKFRHLNRPHDAVNIAQENCPGFPVAPPAKDSVYRAGKVCDVNWNAKDMHERSLKFVFTTAVVTSTPSTVLQPVISTLEVRNGLSK